VKAGRHATFQLTSGVENLVRARSIQAGLVKQLEALSQENMPSVVHARLVGLLETERVALQTMDESLSAQRWVLGSIAFILTALAVGSFVLWRQKRGRSKIR
jgi:hypothetical protein